MKQMNNEIKIDRQYEDAMAFILANGKEKADRTGVGTTSYFGLELRYKLWESFPLITTKQVHLKSIVTELLWFLRGDTNVKWLQERGCKIWDEWADAQGNLGPVYGAQWRSWATKDGRYLDQLDQVLNDLRSNPDSRRIIVSAWNVGDLDRMALAPCHAFFQFYSEPLTLTERQARVAASTEYGRFAMTEAELDALNVPKRALSCKLTQRSADFFLGVPFNIASYAILVMMVAQQTNHLLGDFIWSGGDCHVYSNHKEQCQLQLSREPHAFPKLQLNHKPDLLDYKFEDLTLINYQHHPKITAPVAK